MDHDELDKRIGATEAAIMAATMPQAWPQSGWMQSADQMHTLMLLNQLTILRALKQILWNQAND